MTGKISARERFERAVAAAVDHLSDENLDLLALTVEVRVVAMSEHKDTAEYREFLQAFVRKVREGGLVQ